MTTRAYIRPIAILIGMIPLVALIAFMLAYGKSEYPFGDTNVTSVITALKTADGSLTAQDLLQIHYGHRMIFSRALTAFSTALFDWDTRIEVWSNVVLGVLNWLILIAIFARFHPKRVHWVVFPAGLFILTTDQAINWLAGVHNVWHFALFFSLLAVLTLTYTGKKWRSVGLSAFFGLCATFSMAAGLVVWGVLIVALISLNYRNWKHYLFILIAGVIAVVLYFSNTGMGGGWSSPEYGRVLPPDPLTFITFGLILVARPVINNQQDFFAPFIGGLAIVVLLINFAIYYRRHKTLAGIAIWLPIVAYSFGNACLIGISRYYYFGMTIAQTERYLHPTLPFWVALFAVCIINISPKRLVSGMNIAFMVGIIALHGVMLNREWAYLEFDLPVEGVQAQGDCLANFPVTQYTGCWDASKHSPYLINLHQTAAWRLAGYARIPQEMVLYPYMGEKIIINTETIWQGVHIRDFLLDGAENDAILHIATDGQQAIFADEISLIPDPPLQAFFGDSPDNRDSLNRFVADESAFWYITRPQLYADETLSAYRALIEENFVPARRTSTPTLVNITRYIMPFATEPTATFGDMTFMGWRFVGDTDFEACETITLQTAWTANIAQAQTIHLSFALVDNPITRAILNTDAPISPIPVQFWDVDKPYYDERLLTIPCDLPSGTYSLTLTLYGITDGGDILPNLPLSDTMLPAEGHLLVIGSVEVK
ncbi:MAG: hypothetical protein SFZ02_07965 [bacterium]|nr:hypothetical protein [bacterium]